MGLRQRLSQLQERHQAALEAAETERDLALVISRLEDFSAKVAKGLDNLDQLACSTSFEPSYVGSKSTTPDPLMKVAVGRCPESGAALASQFGRRCIGWLLRLVDDVPLAEDLLSEVLR